MKRFLLIAAAIGISILMQGCAIYASPYGYSAGYGYYGYVPYFGFGFNYYPHSYYSYRPYYHGGRPGYRGWGGGPHSGGNYGGWHGR